MELVSLVVTVVGHAVSHFVIYLDCWFVNSLVVCLFGWLVGLFWLDLIWFGLVGWMVDLVFLFWFGLVWLVGWLVRSLKH